MNRYLKYWRITGRSEAFQAQIVNYADDFVILSRGYAAEALNWTRGVMKRIGLTLNETKTSIKQARREQFDFLGYTFGPWRYRKTGALYLGTSPSKKSVSRLRRKVGGLRTAVDSTEPFALSVTYIGMRQKAFRGIIPEKDFREKMIPGLNSYDPAGEVAMLLLRDGNPHTFLPGFASTAHTPRELHEAVTSEPEMHQKPN